MFSRLGGLGLLAKHLPMVYPDSLRQITVASKFSGNYGVVLTDCPGMASDDWVKVDNSDDFYDVSISMIYLCLAISVVILVFPPTSPTISFFLHLGHDG